MSSEVSDQEFLIGMIMAERRRQDRKWGAYRDLPDSMWITILVEEVGELAKAVFEEDGTGVLSEAIQVAAVVLNMLESRHYHRENASREDEQ